MILPLANYSSNSHADRASPNAFSKNLPYQEITARLRNTYAASAVPTIRRDYAWRRDRIAKAAYYLAAIRGFEPGHDAEDWSLAELQIDSIDAGRNVVLGYA